MVFANIYCIIDDDWNTLQYILYVTLNIYYIALLIYYKR